MRSSYLAGGGAGAQPVEGRLALEEEHAAELDAAGDLAAAGAFVEPALPGLRPFRRRQLGDELVESQQPRGRRGLARGRDPLRELLGEPWRERVGEHVDRLGARRPDLAAGSLVSFRICAQSSSVSWRAAEVGLGERVP